MGVEEIPLTGINKPEAAIQAEGMYKGDCKPLRGEQKDRSELVQFRKGRKRRHPAHRRINPFQVLRYKPRGISRKENPLKHRNLAVSVLGVGVENKKTQATQGVVVFFVPTKINHETNYPPIIA